MSDDTISIKVKLRDAAKFSAEARGVTIEIDAMGDAAARANRKSRDAGGGLNILQKATAFKPALFIAGMALATQVLSTGTAGVFAYTSALAPLVGLLGVLPGALLAGAQSAGLLKLAFSGVTGALGGLHEEVDPKKFALLSGPAQAFVLTLNNMKAPILDLQRRVQNGLFPGLTAGLKAASPAVHALLGPLGQTGKVFGDLGDRLGHLVGSRGFLSDLRSQASFNNVQLSRLGGAGLHVVDALRQIMVASRPLVTILVHMVDGWAKSADAMATTGRRSGTLQRFFKETGVVVGDLVKIGGNFVVTLFDIGRVAKAQLGDSLLATLVRGSTELRRWSQSAAGVKSITRYFAEAKPAVAALGRLIGVLVTDLGGLGGAGGLGVFKVEAEGLTDVGIAIGYIEKEVPVGAQAITILATAFVACNTAVKAAIVTTKAWAIVTTAWSAAAGGAAIATRLLATALVTLDLALFANPVGIIVLAVVALAGAFVLAYEKVTWFRKGVNSVVGFIKQHWMSLASVLIGPFLLLPIFVATHFDKIVSFVAGMPRRISRAAVGMWQGLATEFQRIWQWIENTVKSGLNWISRQIKGALGGGLHGGSSVSHLFLHTIAPLLFPGLAAGGVVTGGGGVLVGERGPELLTLPRAAQVTPLTPSLTAPRVADVRMASAGPGRSSREIHVHSYLTVKLDGQKVCEGVNSAVARDAALS